MEARLDLIVARLEIIEKRLCALDGGGPTVYTNTELINATDVITIQRCLDAGVDVNTMNVDGWTPLMLAAARDDYKSVNILLKAGANVNAHNSDKFTVLMAAAKNGSARCIITLTDAGALLNDFDNTDRDAISYAVESQEWLCVILLMNIGAKVRNSFLFDACINNAPVSVIQQLLGSGADPFSKDSDGKTAFDLVTDKKIVKFVNECNRYGMKKMLKLLNEQYSA